MSAKKPTLTDIVTVLIRSEEKAHRRLERGLTLAYTPGALNNGIHRLALSRKGVFPSQDEIEIVRRDLYKALANCNRIPEIINLEPNRVVGTTRYHVLFWREGVQERLL